MSDAARNPAGFWHLAGVVCVLGVVAGAVALLASGDRGDAPPHELVDPAFEVATLPFGLELASAQRFPLGTSIVHLRRPGAQPLAIEPPPETKDAPPSDDAAKSSEPKIQWRKLPIAPVGEAPAEALLLTFSGGPMAVRAWIDAPASGSLSDLGDQGGRVAIESGTFRWDAFEPRFVLRRKFEPPGTYTDEARIDLSANGRAWGLAVLWRKGVTGSREQAQAIALAFKPKPPEKKAAEKAAESAAR